MKRRRFLQASLAGVAIAAGTPADAQESVQSQLSSVYIAMLLSVGLGMRASARDQGLSVLQSLRAQVPNWNTLGEAADIAHLTFQLTDASDAQTALRAATFVVDTCVGINHMSPGSVTLQYRTICAAAALVLQNPSVLAQMSLRRSEVALFLLCFAGCAPGAERVEWARLGLRETRQYGQEAVAAAGSDHLTERWMAVGTAVAGDYAEAARQYQSVLENSIGAMNDVAAGHPQAHSIGEAVAGWLFSALPHTHVEGLVQTLAGTPVLQAEAATIAILNGDQARGVTLMEEGRSGQIATRDLSGASSALDLEAALTRAGATLVQVALTQVGCLALVSRMNHGRLERSVGIDFGVGGWLLPEALGGYSEGFTRHPGLLQKFDRANRAPARRAQQEMMSFVAEASTSTEALVGGTIRNSLRAAHVGPNDDVLVVVPAALAALPIGAAKDNAGEILAQAYRLRYAPSLNAAWASEQERARHDASTATVALIQANASGRGALPYAAFEAAAVLGMFPESRRQPVGPAASGAEALSKLAGADYWHIASHGVWDFRHQDSAGLLLAGNRPTTVTDILALQLQSRPRMVFLSACETDLIDVERDLNKFVGLNTAFIGAGAACVVGTHWAVNDAATALLAVKFYEAHVRQQQAPAEALQTAQNWLRSSTLSQLSDEVSTLAETGVIAETDAEALSGFLADSHDQQPFADPYFWAGFQVCGV